MKPIDEKKETVTFRCMSHDESGMRHVEKIEVGNTHNVETLRHIEKKLIDKGVHRKDRHPVDGLPIDRQRKSGRGGKYTWEGPAGETGNNLEEYVPAAMDENDPNYVDEEAEERILRGEVSGVEGMVVGEVEVAKLAEEGLSTVYVDPKLQTNM